MYIEPRHWAIVGVVIALLGGTLFAAFGEELGILPETKPKYFESTSMIYVIDPSTHKSAWQSARESISLSLKDPFGAIEHKGLVYADDISPESSASQTYKKANDVFVIAITADSEVLGEVSIVDTAESFDAARSIFGDANESRAREIYSSVLSNSTGLWGHIADEYLSVTSNYVVSASSCEDYANTLVSENNQMQKAFRYTDQGNAVERLCKLAEDITEGLAEADVLYLQEAGEICEKLGSNRKCSDIPGALREVNKILMSKSEDEEDANRDAEDGTYYNFGACIYFGSDMVTYSEATGDQDVQQGLKTWSSTTDAKRAGQNAADEIFSRGIPNLELGVKVAMPDRGSSTRQVFSSTTKSYLDNYWEAFFERIGAEETSKCS